MDCNYTRIGFKVCACTVSLPLVRKKNLFHKLISVIQMFNEKNFCGSVTSMKYFKHQITSKLHYLF